MTIVIAAWNEQEAIIPTLERIADLAYRGPIEVVLADNNSTDQTAELAGERDVIDVPPARDSAAATAT